MQADPNSPSKFESQIDFSDGFTPTTSYRTLSLDTLSSEDDFRLKQRGRRPIPYPWGSLTTDGIDKAQAAPLYRYTNRGFETQKTLAKTFNEAGMHPKKLTSENCVSDSTTRVVDAAQRKKFASFQKPRGTNPLDPVYKLPSFTPHESPVPRFIKDNLDVSDIRGTSPFPVQKAFLRNTLELDDIDGTKVGWRPRYRKNFGKNIRDLNLDVTDINKARKKFVNYDKDALRISGKQRIKRSDSITFSLKTSDIRGAQSRHMSARFATERNQASFRPTNNIDDIPGARPKPLKSKSKVARPYSAPVSRDAFVSKAKEIMGHQAVKDKLEAQYTNILQSFKQKDRDGSGKLTQNEFTEVMKKNDIEMKPDEANAVLQGFDTNNTGYIDYQKMLEVVCSKSAPPKQQQAATKMKGEAAKDPAADEGQKHPSDQNAKPSNGEWKPSKYGVVKADRPHTAHPGSVNNGNGVGGSRKRCQGNQRKERPLSSPVRRKGSAAESHSSQSTANGCNRPKSAMPLSGTPCRLHAWETTQLKEDIATVRALR